MPFPEKSPKNTEKWYSMYAAEKSRNVKKLNACKVDHIIKALKTLKRKCEGIKPQHWRNYVKIRIEMVLLHFFLYFCGNCGEFSKLDKNLLIVHSIERARIIRTRKLFLRELIY